MSLLQHFRYSLSSETILDKQKLQPSKDVNYVGKYLIYPTISSPPLTDRNFISIFSVQA
jgi:hypothetical protein